MSSVFRYQLFAAVSANLGRKVPVGDDVLPSLGKEHFATTSLDENCIDFLFRTDRKFYAKLKQTFLALKPKLIEERCYENHIYLEARKRAQG